jgi:hypothetical protein
MLERRMEEQNFQRYQTGILAATVRNLVRSSDDEPIDPVDYVPAYVKRREEEQTDEQRIAAMAKLFGSGPSRGRPN